jgi:two-component system alkaline phosphatase synthesis response regulator PhoP
MKQRILVVDDDREIVRLVRAYLEQSGFQVLTAYDGETALHILRRERPDLLLLDLMLPGRDGLDVTRVVRGDVGLAALPIIMLTARVEDQEKIVGLEVGADDYVTKPFNPREVVARVRAVLRRTQGEPAPARVIQVAEVTIDLDRHQVLAAGQPVHLTPTEFRLLACLVRQRGRPVTHGELLREVWGPGYADETANLAVYIRYLREKLEETPAAPRYICTEWGIGYRFRSEDE